MEKSAWQVSVQRDESDKDFPRPVSGCHGSYWDVFTQSAAQRVSPGQRLRAATPYRQSRAALGSVAAHGLHPYTNSSTKAGVPLHALSGTHAYRRFYTADLACGITLAGTVCRNNQLCAYEGGSAIYAINCHFSSACRARFPLARYFFALDPWLLGLARYLLIYRVSTTSFADSGSGLVQQQDKIVARSSHDLSLFVRNTSL